MITTIQLHEEVKNGLKRMKEASGESYEGVILRLMNFVESQKRRRNGLLIEQCKVMAEDSLRIAKEWKEADAELDWEWDNDKKR